MQILLTFSHLCLSPNSYHGPYILPLSIDSDCFFLPASTIFCDIIIDIIIQDKFILKISFLTNIKGRIIISKTIIIFKLYRLSFRILRRMTESITDAQKLSAVQSNLTEEYIANAYFVENLRKQSNKIEEILAYVDRLKSQLNLKDKLIQQLKKRQSDCSIDMLRVQQSIRIECDSKIKLVNLKIQELEENNNKLLNQNSQLRSRVQQFKSHPEMGRIRHIQSQQTEELFRKLDFSKAATQKWKQKYNACKEECSILHTQLENERKINHELQSHVSNAFSRHGFTLQQQEFKHSKLSQQLSNTIKQKCALQQKNSKLQEHIYAMENQLSIQLNSHENQMKNILAKIAKFQANQMYWKHRYYELQATVNHIEGIRANWRVQRSLDNILVPINYSSIEDSPNMLNTHISQASKENSLKLSKSISSKKVSI